MKAYERQVFVSEHAAILGALGRRDRFRRFGESEWRYFYSLITEPLLFAAFANGECSNNSLQTENRNGADIELSVTRKRKRFETE